MYGFMSNGEEGQVPAQRKTKFMMNSPCIANVLKRKCGGSRKHQPLLSGRAADPAKYPDRVGRAICQRLRKCAAKRRA